MKQEIQVSGWSVLLFRTLLSGIFIVAGINHVVHPEQVSKRIHGAAMKEFALLFGDPYLLGLLSGYTLLIFGITFLLGIYTRWSAVILLIVLIPITITVQTGNGLMYGPLWKNIALFGGLLFFLINKPEAYTLLNRKK